MATKRISSGSTKSTGSKSGSRKTAVSRPASREYKGKALTGKVGAGKEWNPSQAILARGAELAEVMEPRPTTTSRYPISNEEFETLKKTAPKAKLAKTSAQIVKDSGIRLELQYCAFYLKIIRASVAIW